jgi:hypothetical protein
LVEPSLLHGSSPCTLSWAAKQTRPPRPVREEGVVLKASRCVRMAVPASVPSLRQSCEPFVASKAGKKARPFASAGSSRLLSEDELPG